MLDLITYNIIFIYNEHQENIDNFLLNSNILVTKVYN